MNASLLHQLAEIASTLTAVAINSLWQGALLVTAVWLLLRVWPRVNAATRYVIWSATLMAIVVVAVGTSLATTPATVTFAAPPRWHAAAPASVPPVRALPDERATALRPAHGQRSSVTPPAPNRVRVTLPLAIVFAVVGLWLALAIAALARLAWGLWSLERLKRDGLPLPVRYRDAMTRWLAANKGSREVRLCVSDEIDVPVAVGLFDSMILIPRQLLESLSEGEVDQISLHELAHLRRADDWSNCVQRLALAFFGWNPAVQFVGAQLDLEREVACDDWVLAQTGSVRPYAMCLTKMAETSSWPRHTIAAPGVFATRKHISMRIERLLGAGRNVATTLAAGPAAGALFIVAVLGLAMGVVAPSVAAAIPAPAMPAAEASPAIAVSAPAQAKPVSQPRAASHATASHAVAPSHTAPPAVAPAPKAAAAQPAARAATFREPAVSAKTVAYGAPARAAHSFAPPGTVAQANAVRQCNGCDFSGVDWSGRDMRSVAYTGVDLTRSKLAGTDFSGGSFNGVDFTKSDLRGARFRNAHLTGCDFSAANLTGVDFGGATMSGCQFTGAQMTSTELRSVLQTCVGCDFTHANLAGVDLAGIRTSGIDFTGADLANVNLSGAQLTGVDFTGANLSGAVLNGAVLNGCDLSGVDLSHVDLSKAKLIGIDFSKHREP